MHVMGHAVSSASDLVLMPSVAAVLTPRRAVSASPVPAPTVLPPSMVARIAQTTESAQAPSTVRAYRSSWRRFEYWCAREGYPSLPAPPDVLAAYLVSAAATRDPSGERAYSTATMGKWLSGIADVHSRHGVTPLPTQHPLVRKTLAGIRRQYAAAGDRPRQPRAPLLTDDIIAIVTTMRDSVQGWVDEVYARRDAAVFFVGYTGALRRSEIVALTGGAMVLHPLDGIHVRLRVSKTDQEGRGAVIPLPRAEDPSRCTPCAYLRWAECVVAVDRGGRRALIRLLDTARPLSETGHICIGDPPAQIVAPRPVFRSIKQNGIVSSTALSGASVHAIIRRRAERAGYPPDALSRLGGHSLRSGHVTQAYRAGADAHDIMSQTRHTTVEMVERYAREEAPLVRNSVTRLGL